MSKIKRLRQAINKELILTTYSSNTCLLEELSANGLKSILLEALPEEILIFSFDGSAKNIYNHYLNKSTPNLNKGCDAVIVYEENGDLCAIFCELKSHEPDTKQYEQQLVNAELFLDYLCKLLSSIDLDIEFDVKQKHWVLFHLVLPERKKPNKQTTHSKPKPSKFLQVASEKMEHHPHKYITRFGIEAKKRASNVPIYFANIKPNR